MTIIISGNNKGTEILESKEKIDDESIIERYVAEHPEIIPLYEIKADTKLLVLIRQFRKIDALGIDQEGEIYVIETKRFDNPDKREIVAQVLDYGAVLWKHVDFNNLITAIEHEVKKKYNLELDEKLASYFKINDDEVMQLRDNIEKNLGNGKFKFVVLMDKIDPKLLDMILYINKNSNFDIFPVDMKYYNSKEYNIEIAIPKLYGAEIKKTVSGIASGENKDWDEPKYFEDANEKIKESQYLENLHRLYQFSKEIGGEIKWGRGTTRGSFAVYFKKILPSKSWYYVYSDGRLVFNTHMMQDFPETHKYRDEFKEKISRIGLKVEDDYKQRSPSFSIEEWSPKVNEFTEAVRELVNSHP